MGIPEPTMIPSGPRRRGVTRYVILAYIFWMLGVAGLVGAGVYYSHSYLVGNWNPGVAFAAILCVIANGILGVRLLILSEENRCYNDRKDL